MLKKQTRKREGFTLIEILVVIGIIAILATIVIIAINPARQFAQARNAQRTSNVNTILNAIGQNIADNKGVFTCAEGPVPSTSTAVSAAAYNIYDCVVPTYMPEMVCDPQTGSTCTASTTYATGYVLWQDASGRVTVSSTAELGETISITR